MGCKFCASTIGGLERSLKPSEMLRQIYQIQKLSGERVSNVVIMGTGEPLDNYDNVCAFLRLLREEDGVFVPDRAVLFGEENAELSVLLTQELGIAPERQEWRAER